MNTLKPQDLRIGNIVYGITQDEEGNEVKILSKVLALDLVFDYSIWVESLQGAEEPEYDYFEGVTLTEEILIKAGFRKRDGKIGLHYGKLTIYFGETIFNGPNGRTFFNSCAILEHAPKHVHELQNVVHALTGQELEINI